MIFQYIFPLTWHGTSVNLRAGKSSDSNLIDSFTVANDGTYEKTTTDPIVLTSYWYRRADNALLPAGVFTPEPRESDDSYTEDDRARDEAAAALIEERLGHQTLPEGPVEVLPSTSNPDNRVVFVDISNDKDEPVADVLVKVYVLNRDARVNGKVPIVFGSKQTTTDTGRLVFELPKSSAFEPEVAEGKPTYGLMAFAPDGTEKEMYFYVPDSGENNIAKLVV